jgi:DNA-binding transcriptional ArsR family regulator
MRIHFTRADLARTYLADGPDPMWELVNSLQALQHRYGNAAFGEWRRLVAHGLHSADLAGPVRERLFPLAPHAAYFPDLLTPPESALGLEEGIEAIMSTPRRRLKSETMQLVGTPGSGQWLADLAAGRAASLTALGDGLRAYYRHAVAPYWDRLRLWIDRDVAARRQTLRASGVERMLDGFRPTLLWQYPTLEIPGHPSGRDLYLEGRGILLVPSYFCWHHSVTIFDPELPQVVVYPVEHDTRWLWSLPRQTDGLALSRLLGQTRAAVLGNTRLGSTTGQLAQRLGVSPAVISHHTAVLRDAGLITSRRTANTVLHSATPLGLALLRHHT